MTALGRFRLTWVLVLVLVAVVTVSSVGAVSDAQSQSQSNAVPRMPPDKQAVLAREATQIAVARNAPQPPKGVSAPPNVQPTPGHIAVPHIAAGQGTIIQTDWSPVSKEYAIQNQWGGRVGADALAVFAGAQRTDPTQGIVVVWLDEIRTGRDGTYPTPTRAGSVRVVGAVGDLLTLASMSGPQFVFDIATRRYVTSPAP